MHRISKVPERAEQVARPTPLDRPPEIPSVAILQQQDNYLTAEQEQLMIEQLPTVRFVARRIHERLPQHVPFEDLYSAGVVGLIDALGKFDSSKHAKFRSYAQFRIQGAILDTLRSLDWSTRELRRDGWAIEQAIQTLTAQLGRAPSELEIGDELRIDLESYQQLLGKMKNLRIGTLHAHRLPNRPEDDPLFRCLHAEMRERLTEAIDHLPERERWVMTFYYYEEMTMKEIGIVLGVQQARVSQIHASAVLHLRARLTDQAHRERQRAACEKDRLISQNARDYFSGRP